jgi:hypothetical protein
MITRCAVLEVNHAWGLEYIKASAEWLFVEKRRPTSRG